MHLIKSGRCRRRKIQTLALIAIIVIIYFFMQFFTLSRLEGGKKGRLVAAGVGVLDKKRQNERSKIVKNDETDESLKPSGKEDSGRAPAVATLPRGVHPSDAAQYAEDTSGLFKCLESELRIPAASVNDDFCDCPDSSDEPGTSACPHGRFYCKVQVPQEDAQFVYSSKVNDGICDCCDGSDEWAEQPVPSPMELKGKNGAVFHTPCKDRCGDVLALLEKEQRIRRQGVLLQKRYLAAARNLSSSSHRQKYGPAGIFYLLSKQCYEYNAHEYRYTVCPFESVKQSSGLSRDTVLGRTGRWVKGKSGDHVLSMGGGDSALCPDGQPRQTQIRFLCGLKDHVISVTEDQKCRYAVRFSTPAAC